MVLPPPIWTAGAVASGVMMGARLPVNPPSAAQPAKWCKYQHTVHRSKATSGDACREWEHLTCHLMQLSQNRVMKDYEFAPTHALRPKVSTATTKGGVHLPRFEFMFKDYAGRRIGVTPILSKAASKNASMVTGYTFYTGRAYTEADRTTVKEGMLAVVRDMQRDQLRGALKDRLDKPSMWEHVCNMLGKAVVVAVVGSAVLVLVAVISAAISAAAAATALTIAAVVAACSGPALPVVAVVAGIALLWWWIA